MIIKNGVKLRQFIDVFVTAINKYNKIAIFVHQDPDFDAMGSAFGLKEIINRNFQDKEVHVMCLQQAIDEHLTMNFMPAEDEMDFDQIAFAKEAMGISVDTPTLERVLGKELFVTTKETFRIDHHQFFGKFCDYEYIESDCCAACQLVTKIAINANLVISALAATYLYAGLLTDTNRFYFETVTDETYHMAAVLYKAGAQRKLVHAVLYTRTKNQIEYENYLFSIAKFHKHVASLFIPKDSNKKFGIDSPKGYVSVISYIKNFPIWLAARWNEAKQTYTVSIRSMSMPIFEIAKKYNGGGHLLASGCSVKDEKEFNTLVNDLVEAYEVYINEINSTKIY